ncbi:MAG: ABC transporter permease [Candidatus Binatia bacterium]
MTERISLILPPILALISAAIIIAVGLESSGISAPEVFSALWAGAAGDFYRLSETAVKACPLLLTGLAVMLALHAGVWNIGAEGQLLVGALATAWVGQYTEIMSPFIAIPLACFVASLAGMCWASCPAFLKQQHGVNEVISTIMLNFIALYIVSYGVHGPLMETAGQYPQTDPLPVTTTLPRLFPPTRFHLGIPFAILVAGLVWIFLFRTKSGFRLRATGANPIAARFAGFPVEREIMRAFLLSGALAGLAGAIEVSGVTQRVYEKFSPGYGYTAIAVALVGQRSPIGVVLAALFFGALEAGASAMQRTVGVSSVLAAVIQATVVLFLAAYSTNITQRFIKRVYVPLLFFAMSSILSFITRRGPVA